MIFFKFLQDPIAHKSVKLLLNYVYLFIFRIEPPKTVWISSGSENSGALISVKFKIKKVLGTDCLLYTGTYAFTAVGE